MKVYTDHEPLKYLHTQPNVSSRQARWLERLGELEVEIVYVPGRDNVAADALSHFGYERDEVDSSPAARYDAGDASLRGMLVDWLHCVVPHVDLDTCLTAACSGLAASRTLQSVCCKKCHAAHLDTNEFATKLHRYYRCELCGH